MSKSEAETRSELIGKQLAQASWNAKDPVQVVEEFDILTSAAEPSSWLGGHQFSDYVLLDKGRKPLAVVEAKRCNHAAAAGRKQAKQYCHSIQKQSGGELPFCFYTELAILQVN